MFSGHTVIGCNIIFTRRSGQGANHFVSLGFLKLSMVWIW